jgi:hypothetical protein
MASVLLARGSVDGHGGILLLLLLTVVVSAAALVYVHRGYEGSLP